MSMENAIERLKAAGEREEKEQYRAGVAAGREWAMRMATPKQLRRVDEYTEDCKGWWDFSDTWNAPFGATDYFAFAVLGISTDDGGSRTKNHCHAPAAFWEKALGDDAYRIEDQDFFFGFGDGVVAFWDEVKDNL
jgi:hypothetical protein